MPMLKPMLERKPEDEKSLADELDREKIAQEETEAPKEALEETVEENKIPAPDIIREMPAEAEEKALGPEMHYKTKVQEKIEGILSTPTLEDIFHSLPAHDENIPSSGKTELYKETFLAKGVEAAQKIEHLVNTKKFSDEEAKKIVFEWLSLLPYEKDDPFITQELLNITTELAENFQTKQNDTQ